MGRFLTLYRACGRGDCEDSHEVRDINWNFNERGLCNWIEDNYKFHYGLEPELTIYQVSSHHDGEGNTRYTRQQIYDTVKHYWNRLKQKLKGGQCYFFPPPRTLEQVTDSNGNPIKYELGTGQWYTLTMSGEKLPMNMKDIEFYEKWFKDLLAFVEEYLQDESLKLAVSD